MTIYPEQIWNSVEKSKAHSVPSTLRSIVYLFSSFSDFAHIISTLFIQFVIYCFRSLYSLLFFLYQLWNVSIAQHWMRNCWMNQSRIRTQSIKCIPKEIELSDRLWRMLNNGLTQRVQLEQKSNNFIQKGHAHDFFSWALNKRALQMCFIKSRASRYKTQGYFTKS